MDRGRFLLAFNHGPRLPGALEELRVVCKLPAAVLLVHQTCAARSRSHPPHPDSLWRSLTRGCELGILVRAGAGTKAEAFRYGLAEGGEPLDSPS